MGCLFFRLPSQNKTQNQVNISLALKTHKQWHQHGTSLERGTSVTKCSDSNIYFVSLQIEFCSSAPSIFWKTFERPGTKSPLEYRATRIPTSLPTLLREGDSNLPIMKFVAFLGFLVLNLLKPTGHVMHQQV
jgi:hypothetical protein